MNVKGSEIIKYWEKHTGHVWKATIPNSFFGDYHPYKDSIHGDWFHDNGRIHHTGEVYLNGKSFWESHTMENVLNPKKQTDKFDPEGSIYTWYCETDDVNTTIYANFQGANPNKELVEINVRNSCFYPAKTGINYITIRGFHMSQAATNWAAPTAEQIGLIGTFWSKGWIIENNVISESKCSGITLGKDHASGHNVLSKEKTKNGATIYIEVILKVLKDGWDKEKIGSHIVRNNTIFNCEKAGICGSFGAAFSKVYNNHIYNIWRKRQFRGPDKGGIKFHGAVDAIISNNCIHDAYHGIWIDWMAQGTRISSNICYNNDFADLTAEVNHGPYLVDNNIFLSGMYNSSQGGAFIHNIIAGKIILKPVVDRYTPYFFKHSTELMGFSNIQCGDDRFYNNIFIKNDYQIDTKNIKNSGFGLEAYNQIKKILPIFTQNNLYYNGAKQYKKEVNSEVVDIFDPQVKIFMENNKIFLELNFDSTIFSMKTSMVTTKSLGTASMTHLPYENSDGSELKINSDFFGNKKKTESPMVGPFEEIEMGKLTINVW
ncbi:right-handed parallel beta-helix repeat-containing protein [Bacteroidota bacterium]